MIHLAPVAAETGVTIRSAAPGDLPAILALYAQPDVDGGAVPPVEDARHILERLRGYPDYRLYVAVAGDQTVVGTFALLVMDNLIRGGRPSAVVEAVVVRRDWRRRGVGAQMMGFAMERCRYRGCTKVTLSSHLDHSDALRFYESIGLRRHGLSFVVSPSLDEGPTGGSHELHRAVTRR
jgi:GNAT superfamily N-acetyltransferase